MNKKGRLYIFEGPDGVGKTSLATSFCATLQAERLSSVYWAFPGRQPGTLGQHIYNVHHDPEPYGIATMTETARQMLHITSHVDAIERHLLPALRNGTSLVLDRYWWSTWVYGVVGGADPTILDAMIAVERKVWAEVTPSKILLVRRSAPLCLRPREANEQWRKLSSVYDELYFRESRIGSCCIIDNDRTFDETLGEVLRVTESFRKE